MPRTDYRKTEVLLPPEATKDMVRAQARIDAWDMRLDGMDQEAIADTLNHRYKLFDPKTNYKPRDVQELLETTVRSKRVLHEQDAGDRLLLAESRLERILVNIWDEISYERDMRERWLAGEFDPKMEIAAPPENESEFEKRKREKREQNAARTLSILGATHGKDPRFSIPKLLQEARETVKELARFQGITAPDVVNRITITNNHMHGMAEELLGDPRTAEIGRLVLAQLTAAAARDDDQERDGGTALLGAGPEAGCIEGEYVSATSPGGALAEGPEGVSARIPADDLDPGPGDHL